MAEPAPELSFEVAVDRIGPAWQNHRIVAGEQERAALAERFDLVAITTLEADIRARRVRAGRYVEIVGTIAADVVQSCVVTLEPVEARVEAEFRELYGPIGGGPVDIMDEITVEPDSPEPLEGPAIDAGEAVSQHLALALDPYPRVPGVTVPAEFVAEEDDSEADSAGAEEEKRSPFAALAGLKPKK